MNKKGGIGTAFMVLVILLLVLDMHYHISKIEGNLDNCFNNETKIPSIICEAPIYRNYTLTVVNNTCVWTVRK